MLRTKFQGHRPLDSREEEFLRILPYMGMVANKWFICDLNNLNKLSFPHAKETPHKIWLQSAKWLLRKRSLKILKLSDLDQGQ